LVATTSNPSAFPSRTEHEPVSFRKYTFPSPATGDAENAPFSRSLYSVLPVFVSAHDTIPWPLTAYTRPRYTSGDGIPGCTSFAAHSGFSATPLSVSLNALTPPAGRYRVSPSMVPVGIDPRDTFADHRFSPLVAS
jgi:hypothetical protein